MALGWFGSPEQRFGRKLRKLAERCEQRAQGLLRECSNEQDRILINEYIQAKRKQIERAGKIESGELDELARLTAWELRNPDIALTAAQKEIERFMKDATSFAAYLRAIKE